MRIALTLLLLASLLPAQECCENDETCCPKDTELAGARRDLKAARTEFEHLAKVEQLVLKDARKLLYRDAKQGRAIAPTLGAAADLLAAAALDAKAEKNEKLRQLCLDMSATYRAMAKELDRKERYLATELKALAPQKRAPKTLDQAKALLAEAKKAETSEELGINWSLMKRGDPTYQSLARNLRALDAAYGKLAKTNPGDAAKAHVANAKLLHAALQPYFADVKTDRPPPKQALPAP